MDAMINATGFQAKEYDNEVTGKGVIPAEITIAIKDKEVKPCGSDFVFAQAKSMCVCVAKKRNEYVSDSVFGFSRSLISFTQM